MKQRFDEILAECLEAVNAGRRTVEECLSLYPQSSDRLEPLLRLGLRLGDASFPEPDPSFRQAARERFLSATQARAAHPQEPRRLLPALPALPQWRWHLPRVRLAFDAPSDWRRVAATMTAALLVGFFGFSTFVLASAGDSLPGDWRYPVKRLTERTRLTFTFGDDARRGYRIGLAEERLHEVQELAGQERHISESVLNQLVDSTEPLVQALEPNSVPTDQIERITDLTAQQQDVLGSVDLLVEDNAVEELEAAMVVSSEGHEKGVQALATLSQQNPKGVPGLLTQGTTTPTPGAGASPTAGATPGLTPTPEATATPEGGVSSPTPEPEATLTPGEATPVPGEATPEPPSPTATQTAPAREVVFLPDDTTGGITWNLVTIGDFSLRTPADGEAEWVVSSLTGTGGERIFVGHRWSGRFDAVILVQVGTGEATVHVLVQGILQAASAEEVPSLLPRAVSDAILHVLESVNAGPP
jgi:hypothetical protein